MDMRVSKLSDWSTIQGIDILITPEANSASAAIVNVRSTWGTPHLDSFIHAFNL
ncbi:MAG: hypothetical protein AVDCRST_MAG28-4189 [uncultured Rubrobacteraceae bacterium]|uniref:Uncharacterized protein n=1 Tax=uncultured Rubrobacteraceae bacterium TaxID=349277 RepID=A0A6J4RET9_9ACTN|nr:MAG: hypothetical protein AVDCRST_MAG28-4189 [uncultured Rubrobacteraceae bacterium]